MTETKVVATEDPGAGAAGEALPASRFRRRASARSPTSRPSGLDSTSLDWTHLTVQPVGVSLGAEISGVSLAEDVSDDVIDEIRRALTEYKVLFFRDQPIDAERHVAFAARFGELEVHPFIPGNERTPSWSGSRSRPTPAGTRTPGTTT